MPYIQPEIREKYNNIIAEIAETNIADKGCLEFLIFSLMKRYMIGKEVRYSTLHDCTYAAQHCADEFRRRFLDKREDEAKEKNGDV